MNEATSTSTMTQDPTRFEFGENWLKYARSLNPAAIDEAVASLIDMLQMPHLEGRTFIDVGCGSGLSSLAARKLGARVTAFDYDTKSVRCAVELREKWAGQDAGWHIEQGSILDSEYVSRLGQFDVVYSWGVLHHTGNMREALAQAAALVKPGGKLFIAIYNDQGRATLRWTRIKYWYNRAAWPVRYAILAASFVRLWVPTLMRDLLRGNPFKTWKSYGAGARGMSPWRDVVDWVGGYPFEVAMPEQIFDFFRARNFELRRLRTCRGGIGCNEFVFVHRQHPDEPAIDRRTQP